MKKKLLFLCLSLAILLAACSSKEEPKQTSDDANNEQGVLLDDKGNPKETIKVDSNTEKEVKDVIELNRKSLNDGDVDAYISTIDSQSKQLDIKEEKKVLTDTLKSYKFDKKIDNIKFLEKKKDKVVVFYNVKTTAYPKNNDKKEEKKFNEVVTLVKKDGNYKFSRMAQAAI
ncbi:hypothetical protein [Mammaliicoccus sp. Dog046]|uniref:hypothetical protein n=1 Tax=Mammaliicoccus sp. Dog046 TaxID=3034233 RepID=UPI002B263EBE|nr:hypothetical protein [Mammaliicoccus sp. Dog046]WQK85005.1 hypothetical protein P3U32_10285 [Mammaliicoccus sp. Dog046]